MIVGAKPLEIRQARPAEEGQLVQMYEWLFAAPGPPVPAVGNQPSVYKLRTYHRIALRARRPV